MVRALGVLVNMLSSRKLLEGFDTRNGQSLLSSASPFQVSPRLRAELAGVAEEMKAIKEGVGELARCSPRRPMLFSSLSIFLSPPPPFCSPALFDLNHCSSLGVGGDLP